MDKFEFDIGKEYNRGQMSFTEKLDDALRKVAEVRANEPKQLVDLEDEPAYKRLLEAGVIEVGRAACVRLLPVRRRRTFVPSNVIKNGTTLGAWISEPENIWIGKPRRSLNGGVEIGFTNCITKDSVKKGNFNNCTQFTIFAPDDSEELVLLVVENQFDNEDIIIEEERLKKTQWKNREYLEGKIVEKISQQLKNAYDIRH